MCRREDIMQKVLGRIEHVYGKLDTPCWQWTGPTSGDVGRGKGYPRMNLSNQTVAVHRVVYTHFNGYIPGRKQIDHKCKNWRCVNPDHLEMVTHKENQRRRDQ